MSKELYEPTINPISGKDERITAEEARALQQKSLKELECQYLRKAYQEIKKAALRGKCNVNLPSYMNSPLIFEELKKDGFRVSKPISCEYGATIHFDERKGK